MDNVSKELGIPRKNQRAMLETRNTMTKMKTAFDGLISRLHRAEEKISELEDTSIETSKTEKQREKRLKGKKKQNRISKDCGTTIKHVTYT